MKGRFQPLLPLLNQTLPLSRFQASFRCLLLGFFQRCFGLLHLFLGRSLRGQTGWSRMLESAAYRAGFSLFQFLSQKPGLLGQKSPVFLLVLGIPLGLHIPGLLVCLLGLFQGAFRLFPVLSQPFQLPQALFLLSGLGLLSQQPLLQAFQHSLFLITPGKFLLLLFQFFPRLAIRLALLFQLFFLGFSLADLLGIALPGFAVLLNCLPERLTGLRLPLLSQRLFPQSGRFL